MQLGSVFIWKNFSRSKDGTVKDRYFVYVGESHFPDNPISIFLITTTTRKMHYKEGGPRESHSIYKFKAGTFGFIKDSILDIDFLYNLKKKDLYRGLKEIETICCLPEHVLKEIYDLILKSKNISLKIKENIYISYNQAGITGLKRPSRK